MNPERESWVRPIRRNDRLLKFPPDGRNQDFDLALQGGINIVKGGFQITTPASDGGVGQDLYLPFFLPFLAEGKTFRMGKEILVVSGIQMEDDLAGIENLLKGRRQGFFHPSLREG